MTLILAKPGMIPADGNSSYTNGRVIEKSAIKVSKYSGRLIAFSGDACVKYKFEEVYDIKKDFDENLNEFLTLLSENPALEYTIVVSDKETVRVHCNEIPKNFPDVGSEFRALGMGAEYATALYECTEYSFEDIIKLVGDSFPLIGGEITCLSL